MSLKYAGKVETEIRKSAAKSGKKQASTNILLKLDTRPEEYTPIATTCYPGKVSHCQLCGSALYYAFKLEHQQDKDFNQGKSLFVGSECIKNFAEVHYPPKQVRF